nr:hypothetical protein [Tanacetum cinerariifolium]
MPESGTEARNRGAVVPNHRGRKVRKEERCLKDWKIVCFIGWETRRRMCLYIQEAQNEIHTTVVAGTQKAATKVLALKKQKLLPRNIVTKESIREERKQCHKMAGGGTFRASTGSENRKRVPGVEAGTSSYVRHTGGSTNFGIHLKIMRDETGIDPTEIELFERAHKLNKGKGEWCDARGENVHSKYHDIVKEKNTSEVEVSDEGIATNANPPLPAPHAFDAQAWVNATGDPQKTVYGFGLTKEAENIHRQQAIYFSCIHFS